MRTISKPWSVELAILDALRETIRDIYPCTIDGASFWLPAGAWDKCFALAVGGCAQELYLDFAYRDGELSVLVGDKRVRICHGKRDPEQWGLWLLGEQVVRFEFEPQELGEDAPKKEAP